MTFARVAALVCFVLAALAAFGWAMDQAPDRALGLVGIGLALWVVSSFPPPTFPDRS